MSLVVDVERLKEILFDVLILSKPLPVFDVQFGG